MAVNLRGAIWSRVEQARNPKRPTSKYYIHEIFDDFIELKGDRLFGEDLAIIAGIGLLENTPVTIIGQEKGTNTLDKSKRNFGCAHPEGYRKSLRLMKQAEKFGRPVICFVDTQGAFCGVGAEERGMGRAIAKNLLELSRLEVPVLSILIGEGGSGGALALAVADKVAMLDNSIYSILSPEGFASILWKDASRAKEAAELMKLTAAEVKELGLIDDVIPEFGGGAHLAPEKTAENIKNYLVPNLYQLMQLPKEELLARRYDRFRRMGQEHLTGIEEQELQE